MNTNLKAEVDRMMKFQLEHQFLKVDLIDDEWFGKVVRIEHSNNGSQSYVTTINNKAQFDALLQGLQAIDRNSLPN